MSASEQPAGDPTRYPAVPEGKPDATRYDAPPSAEADATRFTAERVDPDATGFTPTAPPRSPSHDWAGPRSGSRGECSKTEGYGKEFDHVQ